MKSIKWWLQLFSNCFFKCANPLSCVDCYCLSYLIAWKIGEPPHGNNKTIEYDIDTIVIIVIIVISHCVVSFLNTRPIVRKDLLLCHTYTTSGIYIPYFALATLVKLFYRNIFAESWLNFHIPLHALYLTGKKSAKLKLRRY